MKDQLTITFAVPKGSTLINRLDSLRGTVSRSAAIIGILDYLLNQSDEYVINFIGTLKINSYVQQAQDHQV